jgi:hypothetical protein
MLLRANLEKDGSGSQPRARASLPRSGVFHLISMIMRRSMNTLNYAKQGKATTHPSNNRETLGTLALVARMSNMAAVGLRMRSTSYDTDQHPNFGLHNNTRD